MAFVRKFHLFAVAHDVTSTSSGMADIIVVMVLPDDSTSPKTNDNICLVVVLFVVWQVIDEVGLNKRNPGFKLLGADPLKKVSLEVLS